MEDLYAAMILHFVGQEVTEENISKVLEAAGVEVDEARVKALTTALEDVNIDEAIETAVMPAAASAPETSEEEEEKKKAEKEEKEEEKEEDPGLGDLFD